jgi:hypothetical protein
MGILSKAPSDLQQAEEDVASRGRELEADQKRLATAEESLRLANEIMHRGDPDAGNFGKLVTATQERAGVRDVMARRVSMSRDALAEAEKRLAGVRHADAIARAEHVRLEFVAVAEQFEAIAKKAAADLAVKLEEAKSKFLEAQAVRASLPADAREVSRDAVNAHPLAGFFRYGWPNALEAAQRLSEARVLEAISKSYADYIRNGPGPEERAAERRQAETWNEIQRLNGNPTSEDIERAQRAAEDKVKRLRARRHLEN